MGELADYLVEDRVLRASKVPRETRATASISSDDNNDDNDHADRR